ncbi:MAG: hypothetical protein ACK6BG_05050 [Cyanobacteriota bacterium]
MKHLPPSQDKDNRSAIFWALLSQSIWLPVIFFHSQDQVRSTQRDYSSLITAQQPQDLGGQLALGPAGQPLHPDKISPLSQAGTKKGNAGILLNSIYSQSGGFPAGTIRSLTDRHSLNAVYGSFAPNPSRPSATASGSVMRGEMTGRLASSGQRLSSIPFFQNLYSRSELLGGTLTLQDLSEPIMPPIARAERAQWSRSGDPLAPLPEIWREPMRRALNALARDVLTANADRSAASQQSIGFNSARFVHIPSSRIRQASEIPLALQSDGSVDILNKPEDPVVIDEIKRWSAKQTLPEKGKISPAVVQLHPMEPLSSASSPNDRPSPVAISRPPSSDALVPSLPAVHSGPDSIPASATERPSSASVDSAPPISAAAPEPARTPEPPESARQAGS